MCELGVVCKVRMERVINNTPQAFFCLMDCVIGPLPWYPQPIQPIYLTVPIQSVFQVLRGIVVSLTANVFHFIYFVFETCPSPLLFYCNGLSFLALTKY